jgi:hypothetical protein
MTGNVIPAPVLTPSPELNPGRSGTPHPNIHGAAAENGTIWEGGSPILRIVVEADSRKPAD